MAHEKFGLTLAEIEREHILDTVACCEGNRTRAAKILHVSVRSLRMKVKEYRRSGFDLEQQTKLFDPPQWDDPVH